MVTAECVSGSLCGPCGHVTPKSAAHAERTVRKWFARFKAGDFNLEDQECPDRPSTTDEDQIKTLIENNPRYTIRPHDLTEKNLMDRISICNSLYKRNEETPFLKEVVTGDEKWIIYNNVERKRSWGKRNEPPLATPKAGLHPKKVMVCVWWDWKDELKTAIEQKRPEITNRKGVVFHQDIARPYVSLITPQKLLELG
ncbi:PREDICTED: histone-lysine N-methyltransferase SETMAR-like [Atta colombica]|uniref:histone-lysine N-methyltransferase SETMAR-like n=1 Tax=Atta colombica TaxID=520822 RepID=UPI00084C7D97|nr:PREDICTED: histone-lysine N-methyltransferase SETMAR-like [Atta colombica]